MVKKTSKKYNPTAHTPLQNIIDGNFGDAYDVLAKKIREGKLDFQTLEEDINYYKGILMSRQLTEDEKRNINLHLANLKEFKSKQSMNPTDVNIKFPPPKKEEAGKKGKKEETGEKGKEPKKEPEKEPKGKEPKKEPEKEPSTQPPTKPPLKKKRPKRKVGKKVPDTITPVFDELTADVPGSVDDFRVEVDNATKKQLESIIADMRRKSQVQGLKKGSLKSMPKSKLQKLIKDNLEEYVVDQNLQSAMEEIQREQFIELEKAKEKAMTEEEAELMFGSKEEFDKYLKGKTKDEAEARITDYLLHHDPKKDQALYKGLNITPENRPNVNIQKAFRDIITNQVYIDRIKDATTNLRNDEHFRGSAPNIKAGKVNAAVKHKIEPADFDKALQDTEINQFVDVLLQAVYGEKKDVSIVNFHDLLRDIGKLEKSEDIGQIQNDIYYFNELLQDQQKDLFDNYINPIVNSPADVRVLPKGVQIKAVKEEVESDLDRYNAVIKELAPLLKVKEADRTPAQVANIERLQTQKTQYEPKAKEILKTKKDEISKRTTATKRTGQLRPHFKNDTEKNVKNAIGETAEQQIADIKNWYIFDLPEYSTGVGNRLENPLVQQNINREKMLVANTDIFTHMDSFLIEEGIEERKDFFHQHSDLSKGGIERGLKQHYYEENEEQFLQRFNSGSNGLFSQDQTKDEVNDFQNIYQIPQGHIDNKHPLQFTNNRGITQNDKTWIDNLNIFYKGATIN